MQQLNRSAVISLGLGIFSMLFGAGNLMYPLQVGITAGNSLFIGMIGFLLSAVCLPFLGLISMILFDGDYKAFFLRLGTWAGNIVLLLCMLVVGPIIAIPRITTLSHTMIAPFIPLNFLQTITPFSSLVFSCIFLSITFLATYKESKIMDLLGKIISPLLLICLSIIITKGYFSAGSSFTSNYSSWDLLKDNFTRGYETLDLLGAIFFASIVISLLKNIFGKTYTTHQLALIGCKAGIIGITLLSIVYFGMGMLGMYYGNNLPDLNAGELFREIATLVLGSQGTIIIATAVLMACLSTAIALSAVVAEYAHTTLFCGTVSYTTALALTLASSIPLSIFGLQEILRIAGGPLVYIGYPVIITLAVCNLLHKTAGLISVKIPVALTFITACANYYLL